MRNTTICYLEKDGCYLMLLRNEKKQDLNEGKWIGPGGKIEPGETPEEGVRREVLEETGLTLKTVRLRGLVEFLSEKWEDEHMYLYTSDDFEGEMIDCDEGELRWIPKKEISSLRLWEGDRVFFEYLLAEEPFFHLELRYDAADELVGSRLLPKLILASSSPRRYELLSQIGMMPVVLPSNAEEHMEDGMPEELVKRLSRLKAEDVAEQFHNGEIVLGADTVVAVGSRILGKPADAADAARMIRMLQGRTHQVYTGVTLIACEGLERRVRTFAAKTDVHVCPMSEEEILRYAASGEALDKAGAYGIQGSFAAFVSGIDGEYANVVGLPAARVYQELKGMMSEKSKAAQFCASCSGESS